MKTIIVGVERAVPMEIAVEALKVIPGFYSVVKRNDDLKCLLVDVNESFLERFIDALQ